jgi:hypothetical protein
MTVTERTRERRQPAWPGIGFLVLLLASEAALTLPDDRASDASVTSFYAAHVGVIVTLQVVGFVACALLGVFAWQLRAFDRRVAVSVMVLAVVALGPGVVTVLVAIAARAGDTGRAGDLNRLEPRADQLLFLAVAVFAGTVVLARGRAPSWLAVLASVVLVGCLLRLGAELLGRDPGVLDSVAALLFLVLVGALAWLQHRGALGTGAGADGTR